MTKEYFSNFRSLNSKIIAKYVGRGTPWSLKYESINGSIHGTVFGSHSRTGPVTDMLEDFVLNEEPFKPIKRFLNFDLG